MRKVVITGATGMIGLELIQQLIERNVDMLLLIREGSSKITKLPKSNLIKIVCCDLKQLKTFQYENADYDVFFHLGWDSTIGDGRNDTDLQSSNIQYTLDAVDLAYRLGCKAFIGAGSQAEYGIKTESLSANLSCFPTTGYGIAKLCAGQLSRIKANQLGLRHCWTRILSIYGPNDNPNTLISYVIHSLQAGICPKVTKCEQQWDYLYVGDCASALIEIGTHGKNGKVYPIGSGQARPLKSYLEEIRQLVNPNIEILYGAKNYSEYQPMYLCADIHDLKVDTDFEVSTTFKKGIINTIKNL